MQQATVCKQLNGAI